VNSTFVANGHIDMHPRQTLIILGLALACAPGCGKSGTQLGSVTIELEPIEGMPALTEDALKVVEQKYSCQLPEDYRKFLLENNGVFPTPDCVSFEEDGRTTASDVFCFFCNWRPTRMGQYGLAL
jgi:hypothetical protein